MLYTEDYFSVKQHDGTIDSNDEQLSLGLYDSVSKYLCHNIPVTSTTSLYVSHVDFFTEPGVCVCSALCISQRYGFPWPPPLFIATWVSMIMIIIYSANSHLIWEPGAGTQTALCVISLCPLDRKK